MTCAAPAMAQGLEAGTGADGAAERETTGGDADPAEDAVGVREDSASLSLR